MSVVMCGVASGLGVWQLQRLAWKQQLLKQIALGDAAAPMPLNGIPRAFTKVRVEGQFIPSFARYGAEVRSGPAGPLMGAQIVGALIRQGMAPVIIDVGWAPLDFIAWPPTGPVQVEGYVRMPEHPVWLGASDNPTQRRFYALDPAAIGASLGLPSVEPFTVVALGGGAQFPQPQSVLPQPPNDHLSYAITWFSLAAAALAVFGVYAWKALREND